MKTASHPRRVLRVSEQAHRLAKTAAANAGKTLEQLADEVLTAALSDRGTPPDDDILRVSVAPTFPAVTRG